MSQNMDRETARAIHATLEGTPGTWTVSVRHGVGIVHVSQGASLRARVALTDAGWTVERADVNGSRLCVTRPVRGADIRAAFLRPVEGETLAQRLAVRGV